MGADLLVQPLDRLRNSGLVAGGPHLSAAIVDQVVQVPRQVRVALPVAHPGGGDSGRGEVVPLPNALQ